MTIEKDFDLLQTIIIGYKNCMVYEKCGSNEEIKEIENECNRALTFLNEIERLKACATDGKEPTKSAPVMIASQNTAERDPSVMPDCAGADTGDGRQADVRTRVFSCLCGSGEEPCPDANGKLLCDRSTVQADMRAATIEGLEAAIRAAKLALFAIRKQGVMPNSSWEVGFNSDLKKAESALSDAKTAVPSEDDK